MLAQRGEENQWFYHHPWFTHGKRTIQIIVTATIALFMNRHIENEFWERTNEFGKRGHLSKLGTTDLILISVRMMIERFVVWKS